MTIVSSARAGQPVRAGLRSPGLAPYRVAAGLAIAVAADQAFNPTATHVPLCPLHALTGIWCPFCGGLRSAFELTRLHFSAAWHYNVVLVAALPLLAALWIDWAIRARTGRPRRTLPRAVNVVIIVGLIAFTLVRNLPIGAGLRGGG